MSLPDDLAHIHSVFLDTAPIIYFIEAHSIYGPLVKTVFESLDAGTIGGYTSVISLLEVLPKPVEAGHYKLADKFREFLTHGKNMSMIEVSTEIADRAGVLGGIPLLENNGCNSDCSCHRSQCRCLSHE